MHSLASGANNAMHDFFEFLTLVTMAMSNHFTDHPASVGETYGEHFRVAAHFARCLATAAGAAAVHAVIPSMCTTTASEQIRKLYTEMNSGARATHADAA